MSEGRVIKLYPSNWLYNAGVIGFLKVLEFGGELNSNIFDENTVEVNKEWIYKSYDLIFEYHKEILGETFSIWGKNKRYPNYIHTKHQAFFRKYFVPALANVEKNHAEKTCNWCEGYFLPENHLETLKEIWLQEIIGNKKPSNKREALKSFFSFLRQREIFQGIHIKELGGAITEMPNSFWNLNFSTPLCHLCSYLIIFHHLAFIKGEKNSEIFINTPHFHLTWDLNKFAEEILQKKKDYELRKLLGTSFIQWAIKRRTLLGAWTIMNIEVIIKKWHREERKYIIDYFDLPYHITKILLDPEIANLINSIGEEKIFDLVLNGKFDELEKANYYVLKAFLKLKNKEKLPENDPVTKYVDNYRDKEHLLKISYLLPELYANIMITLKREGFYGKY